MHAKVRNCNEFSESAKPGQTLPSFLLHGTTQRIDGVWARYNCGMNDPNPYQPPSEALQAVDDNPIDAPPRDSSERLAMIVLVLLCIPGTIILMIGLVKSLSLRL